MNLASLSSTSSLKDSEKNTSDDSKTNFKKPVEVTYNMKSPDGLEKEEQGQQERKVSSESRTFSLESSSPLTQTTTPVATDNPSVFMSSSEKDFASINTLEAIIMKVSTRKRRAKMSTSVPLAAPAEPSSPHRFAYLCKFAHYFAEYLNSGNMSRLRIFIDDVFTPDCVFRTSSLPTRGRDNIYNMYTSVCRSYPDFVMIVQSYTVVDRTITVITDVFGTRIGRDKDEYLYDFLRCSIDDLPTEPPFEDQKQLGESLEGSGKTIGFSSSSSTVLTFDETMTYFESFTVDLLGVNLFESGC